VEPRIDIDVLLSKTEVYMTRSVAMRSAILFIAFSALFAVTDLASGIPLAEILFLITASVGVLMSGYAAALVAPAPVPVRVRHRR
jgi:hypothetical protein